MTVVAGLWGDVEARRDHHLLRLRGGLSLATVPRARALLGKLLRDPGAVVVDLAGLELDWDPAAEVFPAALAAAGGWPAAQLVLTGAGDRFATRIRALRIDRTVPLVDDPDRASDRLHHRPDRVMRHRDLPATPVAPAMARALVHEACVDWSATEAEDAAVLVASELVTNVVQHAPKGCRVSVAVDGTSLRVSVRDYAPGPELRPRPVDTARAGGRGLHLVAMVSSAWGVQQHPDGKTTWAQIPLTA
ncbi:ATP-binding protein [Pseudonocardia adelaidensis]|uniref:Histidine kinase/HSP90-like ATPase domain-containing protein n=1 Tax=Pseudonocardia adelaidensis TaxID=648754 RepID=A0ABP9NGG2_9PSEU